MTTPPVYNPPIPNPAFAVPSGEGTTNARDWSDTPNAAWAPRDRAVGGTPDLQLRDYRPDPKVAPEHWWLGVLGPGRDKTQRHGVEFRDADGKTAELPTVRAMAPFARSQSQSEPRPTNRMSPSTWTFTRPFDQRFAHQLNGEHFSMADHRRDYPILGQEPVRRRRNTWRAEPTPWDADLVDKPSASVVTPRPGQVTAVELPPSRNFRLM